MILLYTYERFDGDFVFEFYECHNEFDFHILNPDEWLPYMHCPWVSV